MRIGVPRETAPGERRVALVPEVVGKLVRPASRCWSSAAPASRLRSRTPRTRRRARRSSTTCSEARGRRQGAEAERRRGRAAARRAQVLIAFLQPLTDPEGIERLAAARRRRVRDGVDPADHARAADGRALVAGDRLRLQGARCSPPSSLPQLLPDADDRGRHGRRRRRCSCSAPASPGCRRSRPRAGSARSSSGFDVRPVVREQVECLGANFLDLGVVGEETEGGYARELTRGAAGAAAGELEERMPEFDVVITTAAIPGPAGAEADPRVAPSRRCARAR